MSLTTSGSTRVAGSYAPAVTRLTTWLSLMLAGWLLLWGWQHRQRLYLSPEDGAGYVLGIIGASLMAMLLLYPLRKKLRLMRGWGAVRHWFRMHMVFGIAGPVAILYHCNFQLGATNSNVALLAMVVVASSGLVGRFLYSLIHQGLYGRKLTLEELRQAWEHARQGMQLDTALQGVEQRLRRYEDPLLQTYRGTLTAVGLMLASGWRRWRARLAARRAIMAAGLPAAAHADLLHLLDQRLAAAAVLYRFNACERLFALWHLLHMPLFLMLVVTGVIHVFAVHLY